MKKVAIIDYFAGNIYSVARAFEYLDCATQLVTEPFKPTDADLLVLPGVGAFGDGMQRLQERELIEPIREFVASGKPMLGICLGMQMLFSSSEEFGFHQGLNLIPGKVTRLPEEPGLKTPHIGWNPVAPPAGRDSQIWRGSILEGYDGAGDFYFIHSFAGKTDDPQHCIGETFFGSHPFASVVARDNVAGTQFHPEKSKTVGLNLLRRFILNA